MTGVELYVYEDLEAPYHNSALGYLHFVRYFHNSFLSIETPCEVLRPLSPNHVIRGMMR